MPFSHLPHDVAAWHSVLAAAPLYLHQAGELTPSDRLPASGGYLVLMGELLTREQVELVVSELARRELSWALLPPFTVAEVHVLVLALNRPPVVGDSAQIGPAELSVRRMDGQHIQQIGIRL